MIIIFTYEGAPLDQIDSHQYIGLKIRELFNSFEEFELCSEIKRSDFWGDIELLGSEVEYEEWISKIAKTVNFKRQNHK